MSELTRIIFSIVFVVGCLAFFWWAMDDRNYPGGGD